MGVMINEHDFVVSHPERGGKISDRKGFKFVAAGHVQEKKQ